MRGKPALLCLSNSNSAPQGGFGYSWSPCFFSSAFKCLGVPFGVPQSFQAAFWCPLPLEICVLWCPQEPSVCSVGPQDDQSHHAAVRQGQDPRSHSHLHGDGMQGHIFLSHSPMSWSEAEGQDESWTCSRGREGRGTRTHPRDGARGCSGVKGFALQ